MVKTDRIDWWIIQAWQCSKRPQEKATVARSSGTSNQKYSQSRIGTSTSVRQKLELQLRRFRFFSSFCYCQQYVKGKWLLFLAKRKPSYHVLFDLGLLSGLSHIPPRLASVLSVSTSFPFLLNEAALRQQQTLLAPTVVSKIIVLCLGQLKTDWQPGNWKHTKQQQVKLVALEWRYVCLSSFCSRKTRCSFWNEPTCVRAVGQEKWCGITNISTISKHRLGRERESKCWNCVSRYQLQVWK